MISSVEGYRFVTLVDDIRINGGILPVRDVSGDSSWQDLRGEDLAFCTEAILERIHCVRQSQSIRPSSYIYNKITREKWLTLVQSIIDTNGLIRHFVDKEYEFQARDLVVPTAETQHVGSLYPDSRITGLLTAPNIFRDARILSADDIRKVYHDLALLRRPIMNIPTGNYAYRDVEPMNIELAGKNPPSAAVTFPTIIHHAASDWRDTTLDNLILGINRKAYRYGDGGFVVMPGTGTSFGDCEFSRGAEKTVIAFLEFEGYRTDYPKTGSSTTTRKYRIVPIPSRLIHNQRYGGDIVAVEPLDIYHAADMVGTELGYLDYSQLKGAGLWDTDVYVRLLSVRLALRLGDHTDFSETGWVYGA